MLLKKSLDFKNLTVTDKSSDNLKLVLSNISKILFHSTVKKAISSDVIFLIVFYASFRALIYFYILSD